MPVRNFLLRLSLVGAGPEQKTGLDDGDGSDDEVAMAVVTTAPLGASEAGAVEACMQYYSGLFLQPSE